MRAHDRRLRAFAQSFPVAVETGATLELDEEAKNMEKSSACRIDMGSYKLTGSSKGKRPACAPVGCACCGSRARALEGRRHVCTRARVRGCAGGRAGA